MCAISELKHKVYHPCCSTLQAGVKKVDYCVQAASNYCKTSEILQRYMVNLSIFSSLSGLHDKWVTNCCVRNRIISHQLTQPFQINIQ